jgi:DNA-binding GntR family transcriptional regulator
MARTLTEEIYDRLREDILTLRMKPGQKVSEAKLARHYNVSRAPIRNVIRMLQEEELVVVKPQAGTIIMPISLKKARDILDVRLQLECYAAGVATQRISDQDIADLDRRFAELDEPGLAPEERAMRMFEVDSYLHQTIWRLCGNEEIIRILNAYRDAVRRIRRATLELANRMVPSMDEMREILAALKSRDADRARAVMHLHITNIARSVARVIADDGAELG